MRLTLSALLIGTAAALFGCVQTEHFVCERDNQCRSETIDGLCVPESGFCAFESGTCLDDSYARYGLAVGDGLAAQCVSCGEFGDAFCRPEQDSCSKLGCQVCLACAASDGACVAQKQVCDDDASCSRDFEDLVADKASRDPLVSTMPGEALNSCLEQQCSDVCLD